MLKEDEYDGNSILLIESICEVENVILTHFWMSFLKNIMIII